MNLVLPPPLLLSFLPSLLIGNLLIVLSKTGDHREILIDFSLIFVWFQG